MICMQNQKVNPTTTQFKPETSKKRVFSGIQPSGDVHLGNYLGAIKGWVSHQTEKENFFCIVDLHALTVPQDPIQLRSQTRSLAAILIAAGIETEKCTLFIQSHVAAHAEACWILNCSTPLGWLERMTQYKDKASNQISVSMGLLDYPVLMAGDILLYDAQEVPVGDDQKQHVELARDIAQRFNHIFGETFTLPKAIIPKTGARVMALNDPLVKMSKSETQLSGHAVGLLDHTDEIKKSITRAVTDSGNEIRFSKEPEKAGVNNLLGIYKVITGKSESDVETDFEDAKGYGELKLRVAEVVIDEITPIQHRYKRLMGDVGELDNLLAKGAKQAQAISESKLDEIKTKIGLILSKNK